MTTTKLGRLRPPSILKPWMRTGCILLTTTAAACSELAPEDDVAVDTNEVRDCRTGIACQWPRIFTGDFTGDGRADYADFSPEWDVFWVHDNRDNLNFSPPGDNWMTGDTLKAGSEWSVLFADFTGNGLVDYADVHLPSGHFWTHENNGDRQFAPFGENWSEGNFTVANGMKWMFADVNGDRLADLIDYNFLWGQFWVRLNRGSYFDAPGNNFNGQHGTRTGVAGDDWRVVFGKFAGGDLLADYADVQVSTGRFWVHKNLGGGAFSGFGENYGDGSVRTGSDWELVVADFNGDNWDDVASYHIPTGDWRIKLNRRNGTFAAEDQQTYQGAVTCNKNISGSVHVSGHPHPVNCNYQVQVTRQDCDMAAACWEAEWRLRQLKPICITHGALIKSWQRAEPPCGVTE